jgi:hypothetical protein
MTDKVLVTNMSALKAKYGARVSRVRAAVTRLAAADKKRGIRTRLVLLDSKAAMKKLRAPAVTDAADPEQNKKAIDGVFKKLAPEYLLILGAPDVVPHQDLENPVFDADDDPDPFASSDMPYACEAPYSRKPHDFVAATRVVGRLPDETGGRNPAYLVGLLKTAATWASVPDEEYSAHLAFSAQIWERSTRLSLRKVFGTAVHLQLSPPRGPKWTSAQLARRAHFINCHGASDDFRFYGERRSDGHQPVCHDARVIEGRIATGTVVAAECCYGSELYDAARARGQAGICSTYLAGGAYAFVGSTTIAYGPRTTNNDADLICQFFLRRVLGGASIGRAFLEARQEFAQSQPELDPFNIKTLAQFTLLGDPSICPVTPEEGSAPQASGRRAGKKGRAAAAGAERADRRRTLMHTGLTIERTQARAIRTPRAPVPPGVTRALLQLARQSGMVEPRILSYRIARPGTPLRATAARALARKAAAPTRFHVVLGRRRRKGVTPPVVGIVAREVAGAIVSTREVFRR